MRIEVDKIEPTCELCHKGESLILKEIAEGNHGAIRVKGHCPSCGKDSVYTIRPDGDVSRAAVAMRAPSPPPAPPEVHDDPPTSPPDDGKGKEDTDGEDSSKTPPVSGSKSDIPTDFIKLDELRKVIRKYGVVNLNIRTYNQYKKPMKVYAYRLNGKKGKAIDGDFFDALNANAEYVRYRINSGGRNWSSGMMKYLRFKVTLKDKKK